jgi:hypothetical protein
MLLVLLVQDSLQLRPGAHASAAKYRLAKYHLKQPQQH